MNFEIITIDWEKPILVANDTYAEADTIVFEKHFDKDNYSNCLYQAYGNSIIYGFNKLLYIGITNNLLNRSSQHIKSDFNRILNLSLSVGKVTTENNKPIDLKIIESILICYLKPSYNSDNIKDIYTKSKEKRILILNKGNRGALPLECSNHWWFDENGK